MLKKTVILFLTIILLISCATVKSGNNSLGVDSEVGINSEVFAEEENQRNREYENLVMGCLSGSETDFEILRYLYSETDYFDPNYNEVAHTMKTLIDEQRNLEASNLVENTVMYYLGDLEYIFYSTIGMDLCHHENTGFFQYVLWNLIDSIEDSGDGQSQETAFVVISVSEEYVFLYVNGYYIHSQDFIETPEHCFDRLIVGKENSEETQVLYFNVDIPMEAYSRFQ